MDHIRYNDNLLCAGLFYQNNIIQYKFKRKRDIYYAGNCRNFI